ncbi:MAG: threonine/serine dehydratase [Clostridiales bacterium]
MEKTGLILRDIYEAEKRIQPYTVRTPLLRCGTLDEILGCEVYLKPEMLQVTGAFKMRGAANKILSLTEGERSRGIITSSSGNHGQACAFAGQTIGIGVTVVLPEDAPQIKINKVKAFGAKVLLGPRYYNERMKMVKAEQEKHGYMLVHAYEDYTVMAGQGTIALEILRDCPGIETILVPVGGGGLISGISTAIKEINPRIRVIGAQSKSSAAYVESRKLGHKVEVECLDSIADGLTCREPGNNPYPIIEKYVDDIVAVSEEDIKASVRLIANHAKLIAEPSSCVGIAALLGGHIKIRSDEKLCFVLTSGNWDIDMIGKIFNETL